MLQKHTRLQLWLKLGQKVYINGSTRWYAKIMATRAGLHGRSDI